MFLPLRNAILMTGMHRVDHLQLRPNRSRRCSCVHHTDPHTARPVERRWEIASRLLDLPVALAWVLRGLPRMHGLMRDQHIYSDGDTSTPVATRDIGDGTKPDA